MTILPLILLAVSPFQIDGTFTDWDKGITRAEDEFYSSSNGAMSATTSIAVEYQYGWL